MKQKEFFEQLRPHVFRIGTARPDTRVCSLRPRPLVRRQFLPRLTSPQRYRPFLHRFPGVRRRFYAKTPAAHSNVALGKLAEDIAHPGLHSLGRITANPAARGYAISQKEANPMDITSETVGILFDYIHDLQAVETVNPERERRSHAETLQKNHDVLHPALFLPCL